MKRWMRRLRYWTKRSRMEAELAEEMEFHRAMLARDGAPPSAWGNATYAREEARGVWIWPWLESLGKDAIYGVRAMRNQPGFTAVALTGLGLAIGVNTSLFTVFNGIALRPWPAKDPDRVVKITRFLSRGTMDFPVVEQRFFAEHAKSLSSVAAIRGGERMKVDGRPLNATCVSANYFDMMGAPMALGRGFLAEEDRPGAPQPVAVLSHLAWQTGFGGDPRMVGRTIVIDELPFTVVGVAGRDFEMPGPQRNDLWVPLAARKLLRPKDPYSDAYLTSAEHCCTPVAARLAPGVTREQAETEITLLDRRFREQHKIEPQGTLRLTSTAWIAALARKKEPLAIFSLLFLAVTLILLLACANVGNLLLARAAARRREIAVRLSIGGSRPRIVRQLLVESSVLALGAAAIGIGIAFVLPPAVVRVLAGEHAFDLRPDSAVLAYTIGVAALACLAFGLAPALHCTRGSTSAALKGDDRGSRLRLRSVLLGAQVAISVMLLTGAGMLVRGLARTQTLDPGFDVHGVTQFAIDLPAQDYGPQRTAALIQQLLATLERAPGLPVTGLGTFEPLGNGKVTTSFRFPGEPENRQQRIQLQAASAGYFDALRIPVLAGRNFGTADIGRHVAIVNQTAASRWQGDNPVGKTLVWASHTVEVVGVARDAHLSDLGVIEPMMFLPISNDFGAPRVFTRDRSPAGVERIAAVIRAIEPRAEVTASPLAGNFDRHVAPSRNSAAIAGAMGLLALVLASIGMSGVFAYAVRQRTREIGVRMALGAQPADVVRLIAGSNVRVVIVGLLVGSAGAAAASMGLGAIIPGIQAADPVSYLGVTLLLAGAAVLAGAAPARRATRVDPVRALRCD